MKQQKIYPQKDMLFQKIAGWGGLYMVVIWKKNKSIREDGFRFKIRESNTKISYVVLPHLKM